MKRLFFFGLILCILMISCQELNPKHNNGLDSDNDNELDSDNDYGLDPDYDYAPLADLPPFFKDNNIYSGWNLGNTLDSVSSSGKGGETEWGNPKANQTLMNGIKELGFGVIRIPVTWMGHIGDAPGYNITEERLNRVAEVADMAHNAGLLAIINIHHDGSPEWWLSIKKARDSSEEKNEITAKFTRVWEQIAEKFKDYGDWLIFEPMNEIQDGGWCWSADFRTDAGAQAQFDILNEWNKIFVDKVRGTGGKNTGRYLVIPSYAASFECAYPGGKIKDHPVKNIGDMFKVPVDAQNKIIISFHYYRPDNIGLQGTNSKWGSDSDKKAVEAAFEPFMTHYVKKGIPVIIGECGAVQQSSDEGNKVRKKYIAHIYAAARKYGLVPIYWDNGGITGGGEKFGLVNRNTGKPNSDDSRGIIEAMMNAVK